MNIWSVDIKLPAIISSLTALMNVCCNLKRREGWKGGDMLVMTTHMSSYDIWHPYCYCEIHFQWHNLSINNIQPNLRHYIIVSLPQCYVVMNGSKLRMGRSEPIKWLDRIWPRSSLLWFFTACVAKKLLSKRKIHFYLHNTS